MLASTLSLWVPKLLYSGIHHVLLAMLVFILGVATYNALYNRYFHPLHRFPGPFWGSVTDLYHTYLLGTSQVHLKQLRLHQAYGSVIRVSPNLLCFSDPTLLPSVYHRHAEKTPFYSPGMAGEERPLLQIQGNVEHTANLKILSPTYSMGHIRLLEATVDERIIKTNQVLRSRFSDTGESVDLAAYIRWHIYDTMTQVIYGVPVGMVDKGRDVDCLISEWHRVFTLGGLIATLPWLFGPMINNRYLKPFLMPSKWHGHGIGHIMRSHERMFNHRLKNPHLSRPGDMFDSLLRMKSPDGSNTSLQEAERQCFILTVSSQDTSAAFISAFINYLLENADIRSNVCAEILQFQQSQRLSVPLVTYQETVEMPYFMACVHETLRLSPPISIILPRYAATGGMYVNGEWISEKVELGANPYVIHRNTKIFGLDADTFRPERWLGDPEQVRLMHKSSLTFGYGSRKCLGKNIALFESQKFCAQLLRDFDIRSCSPERPSKAQNWGVNIYFEQYLKLIARTKRSGEIKSQ